MEENKERNLDNFVRKSVKEVGLERPSDSFTETLLAKIEASQQKVSVTAYKPLISKAGWFVLALVVTGLSALVLFGNVDTRLAWLEKMNMGAIPKIEFLDALPSLAVSNTILYSLLIFAIFAIFQVVLLKQRLDRRYV